MCGHVEKIMFRKLIGTCNVISCGIVICDSLLILLNHVIVASSKHQV
jgi:hypothetical protein